MVKAHGGVPETNPLLTFVYISKDLVTRSKETSLIPFTVLIFIDFNIVNYSTLMRYLKPTIYHHLFIFLKTWWPIQRKLFFFNYHTNIYWFKNFYITVPQGGNLDQPFTNICLHFLWLGDQSEEASLISITALIFIVFISTVILQYPNRVTWAQPFTTICLHFSRHGSLFYRN